jgi:serine/threonine protein kinase
MLDSITDGSAGTRLACGRYVLGPRLGDGGTSDVYRAEDTVLRRPVAVKLFRACADRTAERRFEAEARLLAPLTHPALVTVYDTGVQDGRPFLVLQLLDGPTLQDRLADGRLAPDETVAIGARLASALTYIHERGIVHRDVKPSNILHDGENAYLADFGTSRMDDSAHLTATGLAVGTAAYMAPEQVQGLEIGPAADVYSLGLVLLECATGRREYPGSAAEAAIARLSRPPLVPTSISAPLPSLLAAMTRDDPSQRPPARTCAAVLSGHALPSTPSLTTMPDPDIDTASFRVPTATRPDLRATSRGVLVVAALVLTVLLGAFAVLDSRPSPSRRAEPSPASTAPAAAIPTDTPASRTNPPVAVPERAKPSTPVAPVAAERSNRSRPAKAGDEHRKQRGGKKGNRERGPGG